VLRFPVFFPSVSYEVVRIRRREGFRIDGRFVEPAEVYPNSDVWGVDGFTLTDQDAAFAKLRGGSRDMSDHSDLRQKIDDAKNRLPLPELMAREGFGDRAKKTAHCPFHEDEHKSFSVFKGEDGFWHWKCHAGCGDGDEIMFLRKLKNLSLTEAMNLYLEMAGYPGHRPESREYPKPLSLPGSLSLSESPFVYPVSLSFLWFLCPTDSALTRGWRRN
jgi:hypothetical protein